MLFGDEQAMTRKDGTMIEKGQAVVIFKDDASSEFTAGDFAEQTGCVGHQYVGTDAAVVGFLTAPPSDVRKAFGLPAGPIHFSSTASRLRLEAMERTWVRT